MGAAISSAIGDFNQKLIAAAQIMGGVALLVVGLSLVTGIGKTAVRTGITVAKVIR